ncbi:ankyrin repeat domain-containing protein [Pseudoxanthomonas winnipegensis]|uniref:Ankyrin repeat domain-containing protein n=1 Tax=Pseudoxanthomonas winnipegensis TaxID=2480810 RepID=A0A4Q8M2L5_9GAMM|nr:ankyrin repeat domain-containing protein [Pseudoxanthomonas winnipegensis]TAA41563.1 ankyrin repeat domain-containing protein [Pseudoxanthomonas winnipegensis]
MSFAPSFPIRPLEADQFTNICGLTNEEFREYISAGRINSRDDFYWRTSLHWAAFFDDVPLVEALLENNANEAMKDNGGRTPLELAAYRGNAASVRLLAAGRPIDAQACLLNVSFRQILNFRNLEALLDALVDSGADINQAHKNGNTILHYAARENSAYLIKSLIKRGGHVDAQNSEGDTPLHFAARDTDEEGVARTLINHGASPLIKNNAGQIPADVADDIDVRTYLIDVQNQLQQKTLSEALEPFLVVVPNKKRRM